MSTVTAVLILIAFLAVAYVVGERFGRFQQARLRRRDMRTWAPLAPLVGQTTVPDGAVMRGSFRGRAVHIRRGEKNPAEHGMGYDFEIQLEGAHGAAHWDVAFRPLLGVFGKPRGSITAADRGLSARLEAAGVVELIASIGVTSVTHVAFRPQTQVLALTEVVRPRLVPTPERFRSQLELLLQLDAINEQIQRG